MNVFICILEGKVYKKASNCCVFLKIIYYLSISIYTYLYIYKESLQGVAIKLTVKQ